MLVYRPLVGLTGPIAADLELLWGLLSLLVLQGVTTLGPVSSATITTDAPLTGWGPAYSDQEACGVWQAHISLGVSRLSSCVQFFGL